MVLLKETYVYGPHFDVTKIYRLASECLSALFKQLRTHYLITEVLLSRKKQIPNLPP